MIDSKSDHKLPIEALAQFPPPGLTAPNNFRFSRDGRTLTYLHSTRADKPTQQLYSLDIDTGEVRVRAVAPDGGVSEEALSAEEELRRQRERMLAVGITHYSPAQKAERLLFPIAGRVYVQDGPDADLREIAGPAALTPKISPDGEQVAYVHDDEVYVVPAAGGEARQITSGARGTGRTHGLTDFVAHEELGRGDGFWWSPDSRLIAFTEVDETHVPVYRIMHQGKANTGPDAQEDHHYPFAGAENPIVRMAIVPAAGGEPVWMDVDFGDEVYLARVFWWQDGSPGVQALNRAQDTMHIVRFNIETGIRTTVLTDSSDHFITIHRAHLKRLDQSGFLLASERSGFNHIYHYDSSGAFIHQLTHGDWVVDEIIGMDETRGMVYFTGNREHPTEKHLYMVPLAGGDITRITEAPGTHNIVMDTRCQYYVDVFSALDTAPTVTLHRTEDQRPLHTIYTPADPRIEAFDLQPPEIISLENPEGTMLYGALYQPPVERFGPGPYPTVIHVYGGPGPQVATNQWNVTARLDAQYLRNQGFLVLRLDNRGSSRRGIAFESALQNKMGTVEVSDQVAGVRWLIDQGLTDPQRVGIFGWSYGGYMALMCLAQVPDTFKVAVAGAPVTHWDGYDTAYTERYMDTPQANPDGYEAGSVMAHVDGIQGKLLLVHGMLDENVHFRHTARLINALNRARKPYDLLIFPDERHMPRRPADRVYLQERIMGYFTAHL